MSPATSMRAFIRTAIFFLKVFPMLPSGLIDRLQAAPLVQRVRYPTSSGEVEGDLYRPASNGPHPGILVCLGVVPFGVDHPQVPVLGRALARAGFTALLYWSPAMRDFRMDPADIENLALAYGWLADRPFVDARRSGLLGTCVGGAFALLAAASPRVRHRVGFVGAYAPFSSMRTLARDIASGSRCDVDRRRAPWNVDQLTRRVFVHSLTAWLAPEEAARLRAAFAAEPLQRDFDPAGLSPAGAAIYALLAAPDADQAEAAIQRLPSDLLERLDCMSPIRHIQNIRAPLISLLHDRGDQVIPIGETYRLYAAFAGRPGVRFTEMNFSHLDPVKGRLPLPRLLRELAKFFRAVYPMFETTSQPRPARR